jgi:hypothetical protein
MHSHVWSIRINMRPLRYRLRWIPFLIFSIGLAVFIIILSVIATNRDYSRAFFWSGYAGIAVSSFFVFLCWN